LPNNYIYSCLEDGSGALWISTNGGLSRLDPEKMVFHNYNARDGLQSNEFNRGAFFKDQSGMMFFGGINGFNTFQPSLIQMTSGKSPMMVTRFFIQNHNITTQMEDSPLIRSLSVTSSLTLDYNQNDFAFEFANMNFTNTDLNRYAYRLAPYNREWVETDAFNRIATYTNLDHGAYTFQVKGLDTYGVWSNAPPIDILLLPAPWRSPLALACYFFLFLALVYWTVSNQKKKLEQKNMLNLVLERQVQERTLSLKLKNDELETLDRIVFAINRETDLGKLLPALLDQALTLFPCAEKGGLLLWDEGTECFRNAVVVGYTNEMKDITLTRQQLQAIVDHNVSEKADDIWLAETVDLAPYPDKIKHLVGAQSILAMGFVLDNHMEAVLFLACYSRSHAFDHTDVATLQRLREHALSALNKAKLLQKLKEKTLAILRTQQKLLIQEKMASLGTLTAGIAHEINNPTNYAYGGAQNLERELVQFQEFLFNLLDDESDASFREEFKQHMEPLFQHTNTIKEGAQRIMTIVRDLHTFSHEGGAAREPVILSDHIQSAVNLVRGEFKERVQFDLNLEDRFVAYCSPAEINQIILNLLTNGCQAILKKQDQNQDRSSGLLKVTTFKEDKIGVVLFQDNGCGMTEKVRRKIFEPFFTTNRVGEGPGLGLASSYNMIRKMGGTLEVASTVEMGSTITLKLPLVSRS